VQPSVGLQPLQSSYWHFLVSEAVHELASTQGLGHVVWHSVAVPTVYVVGPVDGASGVHEAVLLQPVQGAYWQFVVSSLVQDEVSVNAVHTVVHSVVAVGTQVDVSLAVVQTVWQFLAVLTL